MNAWDRREGETERESIKAYTAFLAYRDMGINRSLRGLLDTFQQSANIAPTVKWTTLSSWSQKYSWVDRALAWDADQQRLDDEARRETRERLIADELADYRMMLDKFHEVYERTKLHERRSRRTLDDGTTLEFIELNTADWQTLTKWRAEIGRMGRLALGLPDKIAEDRHTGADGEKLPAPVIYLPQTDDDNST